MIIMKKKIIFLVSIFLLIACMPSSVHAWKNGSYGYNQTDYDYATDYGTHDWIADRALSVLYADDAETWQWLMDRRTIFLVGTEAPDNSGVSMTLNDISVTGFGDTTYHHIYFDEDGNILSNEDDAALRAKTCGDLANSYISENKLDLAAFYLGAMCHYIGDMAMYAHTTRNNVAPHYVDFDLYHSSVEDYTNTRSNEHTNLNEFFIFYSITIEN